MLQQGNQPTVQVPQQLWASTWAVQERQVACCIMGQVGRMWARSFK